MFVEQVNWNILSVEKKGGHRFKSYLGDTGDGICWPIDTDKKEEERVKVNSGI